jgi:Spy/CpxP family protein refolding chaperone
VSAGFGVRRPLRFLAHKLELDEEQVAKFATILDALKTERAQVAVDQRRRVAALADAIEAAEFDEQKLDQASSAHAESAERLKHAVAVAVRAMHAALSDEQRRKFAYLLRTGALSI